MLEVVHPARGHDRVGRPVGSGRDRSLAARVVVATGGRRAVRVLDRGPDRDVAVAHIRLHVPELRRRAGGRARARGRLPDRRAGVCRLGRGREHARADDRDDRDDPGGHDPSPVALAERRRRGRSGALAPPRSMGAA